MLTQSDSIEMSRGFFYQAEVLGWFRGPQFAKQATVNISLWSAILVLFWSAVSTLLMQNCWRQSLSQLEKKSSTAQSSESFLEIFQDTQMTFWKFRSQSLNTYILTPGDHKSQNLIPLALRHRPHGRLWDPSGTSMAGWAREAILCGQPAMLQQDTYRLLMDKFCKLKMLVAYRAF